MSGTAVITITFEKMEDGVTKTSRKVQAEGFHIFEIVGLIEVVKMRLIEDSKKCAEEIRSTETQTPQQP